VPQSARPANTTSSHAIDANQATFCHTQSHQRPPPFPFTLPPTPEIYTLSLHDALPICQDGYSYGTIAGYQFYVSPDGTTWGTARAAGQMAADMTEETVGFTAKAGRYVRLVAVSEMNGGPWTSAAEFNVFGTIVALPSVTLSAAPASIASGQAATVTWSAANATACAAPWTTSTAVTGSQSVKPTATTTYALTCTGPGGTAAASTVVTVASKPSV